MSTYEVHDAYLAVASMVTESNFEDAFVRNNSAIVVITIALQVRNNGAP